MQRTIRTLRIALPIVFFGFLLLIVLSWTRTRSGKDRASTEPVVVTRTGEKPQVESKGFEDTQTIGGRVVSRIRARRVVAYSSNWNTLEDVQLTIFRPNSLTYELVCPQAQFNSKTKEAEAKGGVKLTSSDGIEIATAEIHFDGNRLVNHIPVEFRIDRWRGRAGALDLDVGTETLRLFEKLTATMEPSTAGEAPMNMTSDEAVFRRKENDVAFSPNVEMTRAADRLKASRILARFTPDRKKLTSLEGVGDVLVVLGGNASPGEDLGGKKEITTRRFVSEMGPNGDIVAINVLGDDIMSRAVMEGPPVRDIVAKNFRVALAGRAVSEVRAESQVVMKELGADPRELTAEKVTVYYDPTTRRATGALLETNVRYKDPKNSAAAVRADYDIANDKVLLTAWPGFQATVVSDGQTIKAQQIEFSPRAGTAKATGAVIAQLVSRQGGPSADTTNVFPANKPVFVNADVLTLRQQNKIALFSGHVRAWQDLNTLFAGELQVQGAGEMLIARGGVRAMLYNASGESRKVPVQVTSDQLQAKKGDRRIDLLGHVKIDDDDRTVTAEKAAFFLDVNRRVERIEAEKNVVVVERAMSRRGTGDKATYNVAKKMIYVIGSPASVTAPTGNLSGQQIAIDLNRNKVQIVSPTATTQGTYKP